MKIKKSVSLFLSITLALTAIPSVPALASESECTLYDGISQIQSPDTSEDNTEWTGDYIYYGNYKQTADDSTDNDYLSEPVKWKALDLNSTSNFDATDDVKTVYLLSDSVLYYGSTEDNRVAQNVPTYTLMKEWFKTFESEAFSTKELNCIATTDSRNKYMTTAEMEDIINAGFWASYSSSNPTPLNAYSDEAGSKVFLLSALDYSNAAYGFVNADTRKLKYSDYALSTLAALNSKVGSDSLYLRECMLLDNVNYRFVLYKDANKDFEVQNSTKPKSDHLPAIQLVKDDIAFSEPASEENSWKLTLKDDSQDVAVGQVSATGNIATIAFTDAVTGENQQISAIIKDKDGAIIDYEKIADTTSEAAGEATVALPEDYWTAGDQLYVFSETENDGNYTDYAGALHAVDVPDPAAVAAASVDTVIAAIPTDVTLDNKDAVAAARTAYDALDDAAKAKVTDYQTLVMAEKQIELLQAKAEYEELKTSDDATKAELEKAKAELGKAKAELGKAKTALATVNAKNATVSGLKVTSKNKKIIVTYKKNKAVNGYQVYYKLKTAKKYSALKKATTATKVTSKTLKKGKTYQVKVRTYTKVNGKKVYGKWTAVKTVKCK